MKTTWGKMLCLLVLLVFAATMAGCGGGGDKPKYPQGDVTFLIPQGPGGGNDMTVRALIPTMKKELKGNVVPVNKAEARGAVAATELATGKADGQKLYFNSQTLLLMPYAGVDVKLDKFQPVAQVVEDTAAIIVKADAPFKTLDEFIKYAQTNKVKVANNGNGALWHLSAIQFAKAIKGDFNYIAYPSGGAQMLTALASGEVELCVISPSESKALIESGRLKVLAVMSDTRHAVVPNVPTMKELGINETFPVWRGIFTTAGTPKETLAILEKAIKAAAESDEFKTFAKNNGFPVKFRGVDEFSALIKDENEKYKKLMAEIKVK